jgi:hypothetical protein
LPLFHAHVSAKVEKQRHSGTQIPVSPGWADSRPCTKQKLWPTVHVSSGPA